MKSNQTETRRFAPSRLTMVAIAAVAVTVGYRLLPRSASPDPLPTAAAADAEDDGPRPAPPAEPAAPSPAATPEGPSEPEEEWWEPLATGEHAPVDTVVKVIAEHEMTIRHNLERPVFVRALFEGEPVPEIPIIVSHMMLKKDTQIGLFEQRADARGRLAFTAKNGRFKIKVHARHGYYGETHARLDFLDRQLVVTLELKKAVTLTGRIVDERGAPVEGPIFLSGDGGDSVQHEYANEDGTFQIGPFQPGTLSLHLEHRFHHFRSMFFQEVEAGQGPITIVVPDGHQRPVRDIVAEVYTVPGVPTHFDALLRGGGNALKVLHDARPAPAGIPLRYGVTTEGSLRIRGVAGRPAHGVTRESQRDWLIFHVDNHDLHEDEGAVRIFLVPLRAALGYTDEYRAALRERIEGARSTRKRRLGDD